MSAPRSLIIAIGVLAVPGLLPLTPTEAAPSVRTLFAGDERARVPVPTDGVIRDRFLDVHRDIDWLRQAARGDAVDLRLFDDVVVRGALHNVIRHSPSSFSWHGRLVAPAGEFFLTVHAGRLVGYVTAAGFGSFEVRAAGADRNTIREVEYGADDCQVLTAPNDPTPAPPGGILRDDGSVIDVIVAYTPAAMAQAGGTAAMQATIVAAMDQTNFSYFNSGVAQRVRLVHTVELAYTETGDCSTDLGRFRSTSDGHLDGIHALRDTYGADLSALITSNGDCCGIAYGLPSLDPGFESSAFSVTVLGCALNHTFAHELGHNLGACHADGDGGGCSDGLLFTYSKGHRFTGNSGTLWRTVMAYSPGQRISHFSNPDTLYDDVATGVPIGDPDEAHNAATFNASAFTAANWRQAVCSDTAPTVTLTSPNGGEVYCSGTQPTVSWTCSDEFFYNFVVELSTDGGSSWSIQSEGSRDGAGGDFSWIVPDAPTSNGLVRVTIDNCAGNASDASDSAIQLSTAVPDPSLQTFTGGESVCVGSVVDIVWSELGSCPGVNWALELSSDGGSNWLPIDSGPGDGGGTYAWTVPDHPSAQSRVRVLLTNPGGTGISASPADFEILTAGPPATALASPNGGEIWGVGSQHDITWDNAGCDAISTTIRYSTDAGASWLLVTTQSGPGTGSYPWTVPGTPTEDALVYVEQFSAGGNDADTSDASFSIITAPQASVQIPSGGEIWVEGTAHTIRWGNGGGTAASHSLDYSLDGGSNWTPIVQDVPGEGGSHDWSVPSSPTATARVRVTLTNEAGNDAQTSAADFTIAAVTDFVDVTYGALGVNATSRGVAWSDFDADGDDDLLVTASLTGNLLFENDGSGDFTDATSTPIQNLGADHYGATWADYDEDGDRDAYLTNASGVNVLLRNDGGSFTDVTAPPLDDAGNGRFGVWADSDLDGDLDLYLVNQLTANRLFRNDGGSFVDATSGPLGDPSFGSSASWTDSDGDGDADLYLVNFGANKLLRNDGGNAFVDVTSGPVGDLGAGLGASWMDFDNDGDPDVYVTNSGANLLLRNDGGNVFVDVTAGPLGDASWSNGAAWADSDRDGDPDLYVGNQGAANRLLRNDGAGAFTDATPPPLADAGNAQAVAWSDVNADGTLDLYVANSGSVSKHFQNHSGAGNAWLQVELTGTVSNADAIGARVRVVAGGVSRHREITAGSGWLSQGSRRAHFGLGAATQVDTLEVSWPSGIVQSLATLAVNQFVGLVESQLTSADVASSLPNAYRLGTNVPNPFRHGTSIRFDLPAGAVTMLRVYDVSGRLVRTLLDERLEPGRHGTEWDGRDTHGRAVASGIYFVRMQAGDFQTTRRIVRLR